MRILLRSIVIGIIFVLFSFLPTSSAFAQTPHAPNPYLIPNTDTNVKPNLHTFTQSVMIEVMSSFVCNIAGIDPTTGQHTCLGVNTLTGKLGYVGDTNRGVLGMMSNAIDGMYNNFPAHTTTYLSYLGNNFGIAHKAQAASPGVGYLGLSPMINIWVVMRNLAYLLSTIAFLGIGIAIMLRVKIDPRTVMTLENQLPKLILGIIFITFSFAIAGLLIDFMYVLINVMFNVFKSIPGIDVSNLSPDLLQKYQPWDAVDKLVPGSFTWGPLQGHGIEGLASNASAAFGDVIKKFLKLEPLGEGFNPIFGPFGNSQLFTDFSKGSPVGVLIDAFSWILSASWGIQFGRFIGGGIGSIIGGGAGIAGGLGAFFTKILPIQGLLSGVGTVAATAVAWPIIYNAVDGSLRTWVPNVLAWFIIYIAIFLALSKLLFGLINAWATILFNVAIGPLLIVFGFIPGANAGFTAWLKTLAANILAFPVTIGILLLGSALIQVFNIGPATSATIGTPPIVGVPPINNANFFIPPLVGGGEIPVGLLLALTVIFAASNGPQIAKDMLGEKENKNFGALGANAGSSLQTVYKAGRATYAAFGKTPMPGHAGGLAGALSQI